LSEPALEILKGLPRIGDRKDGFIFTTTGRTPVSGFSRAKASIDSAVLATMREANGEDAEALARWVFHDLRRTAASGMAGIGIPPHVVEAVLNHKSGTIKGVAAVYNRYSYAIEKRAALGAWAQRLETIVTGAGASNVVELAKARGLM
jgi:integrase